MSAEEVKKELDIIDEEQSLQTYANLYDGTSVEIYKCKMRQMGVVSHFLQIAFKAMGVTKVSGKGEDAALNIDLNNPQVLLGALDECYEDTIKVIASLCALDEEQVRDLDLDDAIMVIGKIIEVNKDFFLKRVARVLSALLPGAAPNLTKSAMAQAVAKQ